MTIMASMPLPKEVILTEAQKAADKQFQSKQQLPKLQLLRPLLQPVKPPLLQLLLL